MAAFPAAREGAPARADVLVIGGAIVGSAVAYFMRTFAPGMSVVVIEPDPTYALASTPRASGGARRLFSCPENIAMSQWSIDFIRDAPRTLAVDGEPAPVDWHEGGYLFIVPPRDLPVLQANHRTQRAMGCEVDLLDPAGLAARFPCMRVDDLGGGVHSPRDGWCDPSALMQAFRRKARALGATYVQDRVVALERRGTAVTHARLASGTTLAAEAFVNASGAWAAGICAMVDMPLPVAPMRRFEHYFTTPARLEPLPYVKDPERLAFRPEGQGYSGGVVHSHEPYGFNFDVDHDHFERVVWPALARRFPPFEAVRCQRTWSGLYEQCTLDGNPILGPWRGRVENLHVASGFSGHGMMHAPAAGRAIAERIVHGRYVSLDLGAFGYERVVRDEPYPEHGIL